MTATESPRSVKRLGSPAATALADLAAIFEDLQTTLMCCERLVTALASPRPDDVTVESLWTTALLSYTRCFTPGPRGMGLQESDVSALELQGDVLAWHRMVRNLKKHFTDPTTNPREFFDVGITVSGGKPSGVAITSTRQARVDEQSVRQTGALAYALSERVDAKIGEHQATVLTGAEKLTAAELRTLDDVDLTDGDGATPRRRPRRCARDRADDGGHRMTEKYNPWTVVNVVFSHLAEEGLHPVLGEAGDPSRPAAELLAALGVTPGSPVVGDGHLAEGFRDELATIRSHFTPVEPDEHHDTGTP